MLNLRHLQAFIETAQYGSFHKAADAMYITPSALIKQINALEEETGAVLFERTQRGLKLTRSGESLYQDGLVLLRDAEAAIMRAKRQNDDLDQMIRVGTSPVSPADSIASLLGKIYEKWPELKIQIVPFANTSKAVDRLFSTFGEEIDLICGVVDPVHLKYRRCAGTVTEKYPVNAAVPMYHPLARKDAIEINDLEMKDILLMSEGKMEVMDQIRNDLRTNHPDIRIHDFDIYDSEVFNQCEQNGYVLFITEKWLQAHPTLHMVKMNWDYEVPYGLLYSCTPSLKVKRFIRCISD